jgi:hypothetical protein
MDGPYRLPAGLMIACLVAAGVVGDARALGTLEPEQAAPKQIGIHEIKVAQTEKGYSQRSRRDVQPRSYDVQPRSYYERPVQRRPLDRRPPNFDKNKLACW